jgi:hypothetical protein
MGDNSFRSFRARVVPMGILSGAVLAGAIGYASYTPAESKYMSVDEVQPGMKGYGLTVMQGAKPERFEVEILGTLHSFRPGAELFIIKTTHKRLEVAKVVAGMSGSPVYINDKMIGAYAYGWYYSSEPIAGVTPIEDMLEDMRRPVPKVLAPMKAENPLPSLGASASTEAHPEPGRGHHRFDGEVLKYDGEKHAKQVADVVGPVLRPPAGYDLAPAGTDLMVAGLGPRALKMATDLLEPAGINIMQGGGAGGGKAKAKMMADAPTQYEDGGAICVELVRGDVSIQGLGTVTHVLGNQLVAFGHPMLGGGLENLPTALGAIHWILASDARSFKLGEPTRPLGALVNDRQSSIVVHTDRVAPVFPAKIIVEGEAAQGAPKTTWDMEIAHDQFYAPVFAAIGLGSALETTAGERNDVTWRSVTKLKVKGFGTLEFEDFGASNRYPLGPMDLFRTNWVNAIGALMNNPWEMGEIEGVETKIDVQLKRDISFIRGVTLLESELDPGEPARIKLTLVPWLGEKDRTEMNIEVPLPRRFAGQTVYISLDPGYMVSRVVAPPENYKDLVAVLTKLTYPAETLVASYALPNEVTAAFEGKVAMRLPAHAADMLSTSSSSIQPMMFGATHQIVIPTKGFIVGREAVAVTVRPEFK